MEGIAPSQHLSRAGTGSSKHPKRWNADSVVYIMPYEINKPIIPKKA